MTTSCNEPVAGGFFNDARNLYGYVGALTRPVTDIAETRGLMVLQSGLLNCTRPVGVANLATRRSRDNVVC